MTKYRTPTQSNYPNRVLKSRIAEVVSTAVSPEAAAPLAGMEKENAAATAEIRIADTAWLPEARAKRDTQIHRRYRRLESSSYVSRSSCESRGGGVLACPVARGARSRCTTRPGDETLDAIKDHNEIRECGRPCCGISGRHDAWYQVVADVNEANSDDMAEEELEGITDFVNIPTYKASMTLLFRLPTLKRHT